MSAFGPIGHLSRAIAFGRHLPPAKVMRRIELDVRRRWRDRVGVGPALPPKVEVVAAPPRPLFEPRTCGLSRAGGGLTFTFLNRTVAMPGGAIDWSLPGPGARDQLWRMNLHYMEYLEGVSAADAGDLMRAWIGANPAGRPGAWRDSWNSYALSLRTLVWMQQLARHGDQIAGDARAEIAASLAGQLAFLMRNLETDLGGNHLIKNIKALIWGSAFFSGPSAALWRAQGLRLLAEELPRQILPDGVHDERSPSYHGQVFADLLEVRHALGQEGGGVPGLDAALVAMAQATADLRHPDGRIAHFNDAGLSMAYAPAACLEVFATVLGQKAPEPRPVFAFKDAGYYGLRSGGTYFIADCGRIAPDDLPAHGHGDVLSFEWSVGGERLIVDQGVFEYVAGPRRHQSRAAAMHNTLCLEGADQADFFGAFRCGRRPNVEVRAYGTTAEGGFVLEGAHDGFAHLPGGPVHVRRFEAGLGRIAIIDTIEHTSESGATIGFLLAPGVRAVAQGRTLVLRGQRAVVAMTSSAALRVEDAVWWPDMGCEVATRRVCIALNAGERRVTTAFDVVSQ
jgi:uncharacterized heparinase superfamily protein